MLEMFLTSSALIAVILLLRRLFQKKLNPLVRYALWLPVALRLLIPGSLFQSPVSVMSGAQAAAAWVEGAGQAQRPAPGGGQTLEPVLDGGQAAGTDLGGGQMIAPAATPGAVRVEDASIPLRPAGEAAQAANVQSVGPVPQSVRDFWADAAVWTWRVGMALAAAWFLIANLRLRQKLRRGAAPVETDGARRVRVSPGADSPCLWGLLRPVVYVTPDCLEDGQKLRHVLAHESAHLHHADQFWAIVRCACLTVWWFDPLVWLAARLSIQDCELACDASAIKSLGEGERLSYGRTLVGIAASAQRPSALLQVTSSMAGEKGSLRERVSLIVKKPRMTALTFTAVVLIVALAVGCTFAGAGESGGEPDGTPEDTAPLAQPSEGVQPALEYLENTGDEQVLEDFCAAYGAVRTFSSPEELDSNALFRLALSFSDEETEDSWFVEENKTYVIPVSDLTQVLDAHLGTYEFDPAQVTYGDYDGQAGTITTGALGFGGGMFSPSLAKKEALDGDTLRVELTDLWASGLTVTAKVTQDGLRFLSCLPSEMGEAQIWELNQDELNLWNDWIGGVDGSIFSTYFTDPREIDLTIYLHDTTCKEEATEEEKRLLLAQGVDYDLETTEAKSRIMTGEEINRRLKEYLGYTLTREEMREQIMKQSSRNDWGTWYYTPENDTYYHFTNGTAYVKAKCVAGRRRSDGRMTLLWQGKGPRGSGYYQTQVVPAGNGWNFQSLIWVDSTTTGIDEFLTEAELEQLSRWFSQPGVCELFAMPFGTPWNASLSNMLYDGAGFEGAGSLPQEELDALAARGVSMEVDITRITMEQAIQTASKYLMWSSLNRESILAQLKDWIYLEEFDAFYLIHGDTLMNRIKCLRGERLIGGMLKVLCWSEELPGLYTVRLYDGPDGLQIWSILPEESQ